MKKIILALVALVAVSSVAAQDIRYGVVGGFNLSWQKAKSDLGGASSDSYVGFQLGVRAEMDLSQAIMDGFYADAKLLYSLKGGYTSNAHVNLGYLELPFNFGYRLPVSKTVSLTAGVGPYFALGILGKNVAKIDGAKVKSDVFGVTHQRFDFGLNYNLGVELWRQWSFFIGFEHSLVNVYKNEVATQAGNGKLRIHNLYIGTSLMF